jgi:hypothetical protein
LYSSDPGSCKPKRASSGHANPLSFKLTVL